VPGSETVSYFAIAPGVGMMNGRKVVVGRTADNFISPTQYKTIMFNDSIADPIFYGQLQTCNDDTITAVLRTFSVAAKYATVIKQRERSQGITAAQNESAGWMIIDPVSIIQGIKNNCSGKLAFYPNPVRDELHIQNASNSLLNIEIYNLSGMILRKFENVAGTIDVRDLNPGYYIIKDNTGSSSKFVKL
jgi:hypothetical protein